jgi:hypothetical protein
MPAEEGVLIFTVWCKVFEEEQTGGDPLTDLTHPGTYSRRVSPETGMMMDESNSLVGN